MPFALVAKITVAPERIRLDRNLHDFLHVLVGARFVALQKKGLSLVPLV